ncbi:MAG: carbohydrate kinase family protein [Candidatus Hadarchaeales archaeon]
MVEEYVPDFVVVGHVAIDTNRFPHGVIESILGGAPTYTGLALAALSKRVGIVSKVGVDFTEQFPPIYRKLGIDTEGLMVSGEHTTAFENIYDESGNRRQFCRHIAPPIAPDDIPESYRRAKGFYVSPLLNEISPETLEALAERSTVVMDPQGLFRRVEADGSVSIRRDVDLRPYLKHVDVVKVGKEEAKLIMDSPKELLERLCGMGPVVAVLTRGEEPVIMMHNGEMHTINTLRVKAVDVTGAGDVFGGAFMVRYLETRNPVESARYACAAAGLKIRYRGPIGFPSDKEILESMRRGTG